MSGETPAVMIADVGSGAREPMSEKTAHIDEPGNRPGIEGEVEHFVLAGAAGSPAAPGELGEKTQKLKLKLAPKSDPSGWELHAPGITHNRGASPPGTAGTDEKASTMRGIVGAVSDCGVALFGAVAKSAAMRQGALPRPRLPSMPQRCLSSA